MLLEYGALIIAIYACLFGPIIAGAIYLFRSKGVISKIFGVALVLVVIGMILQAFVFR